MNNPYAAPLAPNEPPGGKRHTWIFGVAGCGCLLFVLLVVFFLAVWNVLQPATRPEPPQPPATPRSHHSSSR